MRRWIIAGSVAAGILALILLFAFLNKPAAKAGENQHVVKAGENGTFVNDCCGTVQLSDGKMLLNDQQAVRYTVAKDAMGPYILPNTYVGIVRYQGFEVDGTRSTVKLRLDRLPSPTRIMLYWGAVPYVFTRQARPPR